MLWEGRGRGCRSRSRCENRSLSDKVLVGDEFVVCEWFVGDVVFIVAMLFCLIEKIYMR